MDLLVDKYKISKKIGTGAFSEVFLATLIDTSQNVAVKKVSLVQREIEESKMLLKLNLEIELMQKLKHPNIITYIEVIKSKTDWYIILEYCNAGTLGDVITYNENMQNMIFDHLGNEFNREANTYYYMNQLKDALDYIKNMGCTHRDIKPDNILLIDSMENITMSNLVKKNFYFTEKIILKLADFGLAKNCEMEDEILENTICGSPLYMGPEIILDREYNSKADLWSYGAIMYQLLFGIHPFQSSNLAQLKNNLKNKHINFFINNNFSPECYSLLMSLLDKNPKKRIDWNMFFSHKWFCKWKEQIIELLLISENKTNKLIMTIPKSKPILIPKNLNNSNMSNSSLLFNNSTNASELTQYNSPLGFSNLSRMKFNMNFTQLTKNLTFSNQPTDYSPPDLLNHLGLKSNSVPVKNINLNGSYSTNAKYHADKTNNNISKSRYSKNYKQDMDNSNAMLSSRNSQMELSGSFLNDTTVLPSPNNSNNSNSNNSNTLTPKNNNNRNKK